MLPTVINSTLATLNFMRFRDFVDILLVSFCIYKCMQFFRNTRTLQVIKGIVVLFVILQLSSWLQLHMVNFILVNAMQVGLIALVVVFQPELRRGLEKVGRSKFGSFFKFDHENPSENDEYVISQLCEAAEQLQTTRTGALIVIERDTKIGDIIRTGISINSNITKELLVQIFAPRTPLHDGAVIIRDNRLIAAACFLPLSQNEELSTELGTRHRAALGISESSDSIVIIVSEETGKISLALEGTLTRNLTGASLQKALQKLLLTPVEKSTGVRGIFSAFKV